MFNTTIAGSLPKPTWLAEPNRLWAPWRLARVDPSYHQHATRRRKSVTNAEGP